MHVRRVNVVHVQQRRRLAALSAADAGATDTTADADATNANGCANTAARVWYLPI